MERDEDKPEPVRPKLRAMLKDEVDGWRWKAQIGDAVVNDCDIFGISVWQRNKNGVIERLDPRNVAFAAREPAPFEAEPFEYRELSDSEEAAEEATWD